VRRLTVLIWLTALLSRAAEPLPQAHAHNDYEHQRPLLDALEHGFCSVEADVHLVDGRLLVAHDADKVNPQRTLEALYLEPLRARIIENKGRVHPKGPPFLLLIDIKTDAEASYAALQPVLHRYRQILTQFTAGETRTGAVTVVLSGNRPAETVAAQPVRYAAIDGRLPDLDGKPSPHVVPLVSDNWSKHFQWRGDGAISDADRIKLKTLVDKAHAQGRKTRFWGIPDTREGWQVMREAGVDLINTDKLEGLQKFLSTTAR
jgi:glycerophosphoryl diester phosphodiesterase